MGHFNLKDCYMKETHKTRERVNKKKKSYWKLLEAKLTDKRIPIVILCQVTNKPFLLSFSFYYYSFTLYLWRVTHLQIFRSVWQCVKRFATVSFLSQTYFNASMMLHLEQMQIGRIYEILQVQMFYTFMFSKFTRSERSLKFKS